MKKPKKVSPPVHTSEFLDIALKRAKESLKAAFDAYCFNPGSYTNDAMHRAMVAKCAIEEAIASFEHFSNLMSIGLESLQDGTPLILTIDPTLP